VVRYRADTLLGAVKACRRGDIGFTAQNGINATLPGGLIKLHGAEHVAMIGHGHRRHVQFLCAIEQLIDPVRPIQQTEFGMQVQVHKTLWRHGYAVSVRW
jgi:hypothetical protein